MVRYRLCEGGKAAGGEGGEGGSEGIEGGQEEREKTARYSQIRIQRAEEKGSRGGQRVLWVAV